MVAMCRRPAATRIALLRWQLFNLLIGNGDAHLKNLSFLLHPDGMELAPHYDLLSTSVYRAPHWRDAEPVIPMGSARTFGDVQRDDVIAFGAALGVPEQATLRQLDRLHVDATRHAAALLEQCEHDGGTHAGEARLLRQLVHGAMKDAAAALRRRD